MFKIIILIPALAFNAFICIPAQNSLQSSIHYIVIIVEVCFNRKYICKDNLITHHSTKNYTLMDQQYITGRTEDEVWKQINAGFPLNPAPLDYTAVIDLGNRKIVLDIDIDQGGGFEGGYETTMLSAELHTSPAFRFAIHPEHFTDEIGKFFGMEDVEIGFPEFDGKMIVKTNDRLRVREIFSDESVRKVFETLNDFTFGIRHHKADDAKKAPFLELLIYTGITSPGKLREIYHAFFSVLVLVDKEVNATI